VRSGPRSDRAVVAPIAHAWVSTGGTGAQNYDEFADESEITAVIAANPASALAVEMPHLSPEAVAGGLSFGDALPLAVGALRALREQGRLADAGEVVAPYCIVGPGAPTYGLFCMVATAEISSSAGEPGLVVRNEEVFVDTVRERTELTAALGHLLSPVLLLQTRAPAELQDALAEACARLGDPAVTDTDPQGRVHAVWTLGAGEEADRLLALAGGGELLVADGNHRSLAAQQAGLPRFLAVVTTPGSVRIAPYHRLVRRLGRAVPEVLDRLARRGCAVASLDGPPEVPDAPGTVVLLAGGRCYGVTLPAGEADVSEADTEDVSVSEAATDEVSVSEAAAAAAARVVDRLDHTVVERLVLGEVLGIPPGDPRVTYVGGDYDAPWLAGEVAAGRAEAALLIAPVPVEDFVAVNLARRAMPRKSTWFTPKARAGLVVAQLDAEGAGPGDPT